MLFGVIYAVIVETMPSPSKPNALIPYRLLFKLVVLSIFIYLTLVSCAVLFVPSSGALLLSLSAFPLY